MPPTTLTPGDRLGPYEITTPLGAGGMGEVYRARDAKLDRDIAIKVLLPVVANDPERLARFEREAKVLASLNHPNIAAIYGIESGSTGSGPAHAIVMELVEGQDLSELIAGRALPLSEALPIAKQIADALEAAHGQGIVHRDLKPANIKVRPDGTVKVLDFGLAKAVDPGTSGSQDAANSPTLTVRATQMGMILGTAAYMSPEQARGSVVDKRADLWAFGVVLYEMLTGTRLFDEATISDTLAAVLRAEPDWDKLPADTPAAIRRLLRRSVEKDRKKRLADASDARLEIEDALTTDREMGVRAGAIRPAAWRRTLPWAILASVSLVGLGVLSFVHFLEAPVSGGPETRTEITTPADTDPTSFAVSPDGHRVVFVTSENGVPRLSLRALDVVASQPLGGTEGASFPFWSPDSRFLGFFAGGKLKRIDISGGLPQAIADAPVGARGGAWNRENIILFTTPDGVLSRVAATGGPVAGATTEVRPKSFNHRFPQFLPDGRQFLLYAEGEEYGIYLGSLDTTSVKRLTPALSSGVCVSGWVYFIRRSTQARQGTLVAQRFDIGRAELSGEPVTVADGVGAALGGMQGNAAFSLSATGLVAYRTGNGLRRQLTWFDRSGKATGALGAVDENGLSFPSLSPDGRRVAVGHGRDVWLMDGVRETRFTFDTTATVGQVWSRDGSRLVFAKGGGLYSKPSSGAGVEQLLLAADGGTVPNDWSADERVLLYQTSGGKTGFDLWTLSLEKDAKPRVFLSTMFNEYAAQFSPDNHWVAYQSDESGRSEIYIRSFPEVGGPSKISTAGGEAPRWRADGKELYYIAPNGKMMATVVAVKGAAIEPSTPSALFQTTIFGLGSLGSSILPQYDVAPDGRFLINISAENTSSVIILQNWKPPAAK